MDMFENYVDGSSILLSRMVSLNMKLNEKESKFIEQLFKLNTSTVGIIDWRMHEYFYWKNNEHLPGFPDCVINVKDIKSIRTDAGVNCYDVFIDLKDSDTGFRLSLNSYRVVEVIIMMLIIKMNFQNNELPKLIEEMKNKQNDTNEKEETKKEEKTNE